MHEDNLLTSFLITFSCLQGVQVGLQKVSSVFYWFSILEDLQSPVCGYFLANNRDAIFPAFSGFPDF